MEKKAVIHLNTQQCQAQLNNVGDAVYVIGGKWRLRIILALREGHTRFNELQRAIQGISAKVLSNELRELELNGFVERKVDTGTPVIVTYEPTEYTQTLNEVMRTLAEWGAMHREKLREEAR
ncbi:winged helix-turn-helix transcriptional regulator [Flavobacterium rhizosphaerae]|uniref:Helix-turn-helix domain-containing protein n=1 Tax=Flavobacterium rhizosphaerae TaxID=3163298 RepID=A0ABW8YV47_9FLAO